MKSCSHQALSCIIIKTVILLGNFFHLVCVMLLICQQRFLFNVFLRFLFFHKNAFFNVFYSWSQRSLHLWFELFSLFFSSFTISLQSWFRRGVVYYRRLIYIPILVFPYNTLLCGFPSCITIVYWTILVVSDS